MSRSLCLLLAQVLLLALSVSQAPASDIFGSWGPQASTTAGGPHGGSPNSPCDQASDPAQCCEPPTEIEGTDPVSAINGREVLTRTDLVVPGVYPIELTRRYDSQSTYDSPLGYGWAHSFDIKLFEYPDGSVVVRNSCGYRHTFTPQGGTLAPEIGRQEKLTDNGDGTYVLRYPRGAEAHFDEQGNLSALVDRNGNQLVLEYADDDQPADGIADRRDLQGTSPFAVDPTAPLTVARVHHLERIFEKLADGTVTGREITFSYDAATGRLVSAQTNSGRTVTYEHDGGSGGPTEGNLTVVRLSVGGSTEIVESFGYDPTRAQGARHNLTSVQLGQGEATWFMKYDAEDRVEEQTRGDCTSSCDREFVFDYSTPLVTVVTRTIKDETDTETGTAVETFEYDANGFLTKKTDALGNEFHYVRDGNGFLDFVEVYRMLPGPILQLQKRTDYRYDIDGNLEERKVTLDSTETVTESWTYDDHWVSSYQVVSSASPTVFRTDYTFVRNGSNEITNIHQIRRQNGAAVETTTLGYDTNGQLTTITPPDVTPSDSLRVTRSYFALPAAAVGLLEKIELEVNGSADGHLKRTFTYDTHGNLDTVTDARGNITDYDWDERGRLVAAHNALPDPETTHFRYRGPTAAPIDPATAPPGRFLSEIEIGTTAADGEGQLRRLRYDAEGRLEQIDRKDDAGQWSTFFTYVYDSDDNRLQVKDGLPAPRTLTYTYDLLRRMASVTDADSNVTSFEYDAEGNRTKVIDAKLRHTDFTYDDLDRLIKVDQVAESLETEFTYDAVGNLTSVEDPRDKVTTYFYDPLSRLTSVQQHLGQTVSYSYDERSRLQIVENAEGTALRYDYEPWGGLASVGHYDSQTDAQDKQNVQRTVAYTYDLAGNLLTTSDSDLDPIPGGAVDPLYTFTYDELDRVDTVTAHYIPGGDRTLDSGYDRFGNRDSLDFTDVGWSPLAHSWTFDDLDQLDVATLAGPQIDFSYFANDEIEKITRGNGSGVEATHAYHTNGPIQSIVVRDSTMALLHDLQYSVIDETLNIETLAETRSDNGSNNVSGTFDYRYDGIDRLTDADYPAAFGMPTSEDFAYDDAGNRDDANSPGSFLYDDNNRLTAKPGVPVVCHDADGNLASYRSSGDCTTGPETETFDFDRSNRLRTHVVVTTGATTRFGYDPFGRRLFKSHDPDGAGGSPETTTWFLWDGDDLLAEFDDAGDRTRRYTYAGGFTPTEVADVSGAAEVVYDVHTDHLGTPRMLTNSGGMAVWRQSHAAYGHAEVDEDPDGDTNIVEFNVRFPGQYFDEETGFHYNRFRHYGPDVGRYVSADPIGQAGGINLYRYVASNPVGGIDPLGLFKYYGNWCGPDWTGGYEKPWDDLTAEERASCAAPIDGLDAACKGHDICLGDCRENFPCDKAKRDKCFDDCDTGLAEAAAATEDGGIRRAALQRYFERFGAPKDSNAASCEQGKGGSPSAAPPNTSGIDGGGANSTPSRSRGEP